MISFFKIFGRLGNNLFQGAYLYAQAKRGLIPDIYVQDYTFFDEYRDEIRKLYGDDIHEKPVGLVAIHVRRGDYVNNPFYVDLMLTDYYQRAMSEFPEDKFIVFSDDIEWCKQQNIFKGCYFTENKTELEDLNAMASCKGIIMANSSFSWWAAYLSKAKVIAPKAWHPDGVERTKLLPEWKRI